MARRQPILTLRSDAAGERPLSLTPRFQDDALFWTYVAENRRRWQRVDDARDVIGTQALELLDGMGFGDDERGAFIDGNVVEVGFSRDAILDPGAVTMPWEFIITEAFKQMARDDDSYEGRTDVLVVRNVAKSAGPTRAKRAGGNLVIVGAEALLDDHYTFETECTLLGRALKQKADKQPGKKLAKWSEPKHVDDPTPERLRQIVERVRPGVIHVAGVDAHEAVGFGILEGANCEDGFLLANEDGEPHVADAREMASILTAKGTHRPGLVVFNLHNSAARLAAEAVHRGAEVAIGFQDTFGELEAELFIGELFRAWAQSEGDPLVSFNVAWEALTEFPKPLSGTGIVLWSRRSLVDAGRYLPSASLDLRKRLDAGRQTVGAALDDQEAREVIKIDLCPYEKLNYALLHNRQPMFKWFEIRNTSEKHRIAGLHVEAELFAGPERFPYVQQIEVGSAPVALDDRVFVPLTSTLARSLGEPIRASLHIGIRAGDHLPLHESSHQVTLLPTNEWVDDNENRQWLPSFVFPRDPAVTHIMDAARSPLAFLADTPSAGFDGYQSIDRTDKENPAAGVDHQVEAIWSALLNVYHLGYINPPPTYTAGSQRLRFPSDVIETRMGTCIDLTLLLASCLEYVGINPIVFLLDGHAFPGYWRDEEQWTQFIAVRDVLKPRRMPPHELAKAVEAGRTQGQDYAWVFPKRFYGEIKRLVESRQIVPLESVWLTNQSSFAEAQDAGWEDILDAGSFHSMVDITLARCHDVTPLPVEARL